ncbi:hypothetical protein FIL92_00610 [SAR202 cluster bacterium AD-812-D07_MRT_10900m]|nr:hypothetical protein [SAR202 cluster bacterium AD-812-D07_MRT_10900m]
MAESTVVFDAKRDGKLRDVSEFGHATRGSLTITAPPNVEWDVSAFHKSPDGWQEMFSEKGNGDRLLPPFLVTTRWQLRYHCSGLAMILAINSYPGDIDSERVWPRPKKAKELTSEVAEPLQMHRDSERVCRHCGELAKRIDDQFCSSCGKPLSVGSAGYLDGRDCPHCDSPTSVGDKYCAVCSQELSDGSTLWRSISYIWRGRINRLGAVLTFFASNMLLKIITPLGESESLTTYALFWTLLIPIFSLQVGVMISRVHDIGKPGIWMIPWLGFSLIWGWFGSPLSTALYLGVAFGYIIWPGGEYPSRWGAPGIGFCRYWKRIAGRDM